MLQCVQVYNPSLTEIQSLRMELTPDLSFILPITAILACGFSLIWENRSEKKTTTTAAMKADIEFTAKLMSSATNKRVKAAGRTVANILNIQLRNCFV